MGTIAEKLSYLTDTKDLFKDRLNSLGAEITSSTTFRNYLTWLDTFYEEVSDKTDLSVNGVVGRTSQNTAILPSEYTQVDYIESHGDEWIDTNVFPYKTTVEYTFAYNNFTTGTYRRFVASYDATSSPTLRYYSCQQSGGTPNILVCATYNNITYELGNADTNKHTIIFNDSNGNVYFDGVLKATSENFDLPRQSANNLSIFATGGATGSSKIAGKLWNLKIYDKENNNELVRDFIPCYRNSDNEVGLYDIVNDVFYTNQGTGSFTYGSVVSIPNPDYPQPINNLSGDVAYKVSSKNVLNPNNFELSAIFTNIDSNLSIIDIEVNDVSGFRTLFDNLNLKANDYTIYCEILSGTYTGGNLCFYDLDNTKYAAEFNFLTGGNIRNISLNNGLSKIVIYSPKCSSDVKLKLWVLSGTYSSLTIPSFEPYISQTFNIPLGDIELCKIDTYEDKIYSSNGRFYLEKKNGKVVLNGSESIEPDSTKTITQVFAILNVLSRGVQDNLGICNYFINQAGDTEKFAYIVNVFDYEKLYIAINKTRASTVQEFKTWLSTHNTVVYYPLATPTTTEITQENYPLLYNALKQIQDYLTAYKINKEFILGYSSPEIEY